MKRLKIIIFIFLFMLISAPLEILACNECHSKNPKMVSMHAALGFKDCFKCHGFGKRKTFEEQKAQKVTDPLCTGCHKQ